MPLGFSRLRTRHGPLHLQFKTGKWSNQPSPRCRQVHKECTLGVVPKAPNSTPPKGGRHGVVGAGRVVQPWFCWCSIKCSLHYLNFCLHRGHQVIKVVIEVVVVLAVFQVLLVLVALR